MSGSITDCASTTLGVLAGGQGRRMGTPKTEIMFHGQPVLEYLLQRLEWPGPTLLVTAPGREHPPGWRRFTAEATDPVHNDGPLRGILTAIEQSHTNELVVIPIDMPNVTRERLTWINSRLQEFSTAAGVMIARTHDGASRIEPFPAAYRCDAVEELIRARLRDRHLSLRGLSQCSQINIIPAPTDWPEDFWTNLNTPSDLAEYRMLTGEG